MTTSAHGMRDGTLKFSTPVVLSTVVIAAVATLLVFALIPGLGPGPLSSDEPTPTVEPTQSGAPTPTADSTATVAPTPSPTPAETPVARWTGLTWSDPVTPAFTVHLYDLVPWEGGYVAVGEVDGSDGQGDAAFLTSPDGLDWTVAYRLSPGFARIPRHLVVLDGELLAFSRPDTRSLPLGNAYGHLVWSSTDGESWSLVDSQSWRDAWADIRIGPMPASWDVTQYDIETGLTDVASGPGGVVAIGNSYSEAGMVPVFIHSPDGRTWSDVSLPAGSPSPVLNSVVEHSDGFVAVGAVDVGPDPALAIQAAWHSADGLTWTLATIEGAPSSLAGVRGEFGPLLSAEDGLVTCLGHRQMSAGGWRFMDPWISADGASWAHQPVTPEHPTRACGWAASDGVRIVALAGRPSPTGQPWPGVTGAWVTTDGQTWQPMSVSRTLTDMLERFWVVPDGVIYAGEQSFWFGTAADR